MPVFKETAPVLPLNFKNCSSYKFASLLNENGFAVRAGLHCAPLAHESAGTRETGTVRISFGHDAAPWQTGNLLLEAEKLAE